MSVVAEYSPGTSLVHRAPGGIKLAMLAAIGVALVVFRGWWPPLVALAAVICCYALARLPARTVLSHLRQLLWIVLILGVAQLLLGGWRAATAVVGTILTLVLAAGLVSLTTTMTELTDILLRLLRPLQRIRVPTERLALLISLSVRSVSVIAALAAEVRDAQRARGLQASPRAFAVPLLVRSLRHAQALGEALSARGLDD
jgi:biotin transport system permease protein